MNVTVLLGVGVAAFLAGKFTAPTTISSDSGIEQSQPRHDAFKNSSVTEQVPRHAIAEAKHSSSIRRLTTGDDAALDETVILINTFRTTAEFAGTDPLVRRKLLALLAAHPEISSSDRDALRKFAVTWTESAVTVEDRVEQVKWMMSLAESQTKSVTEPLATAFTALGKMDLRTAAALINETPESSAKDYCLARLTLELIDSDRDSARSFAACISDSDLSAQFAKACSDDWIIAETRTKDGKVDIRLIANGK